MAQTLSTALTNAGASPSKASDLAGSVLVIADTVEVPITSNNDEAILNIRIPVTAKVDSVIIATDDLDTSTNAVMDVTLYKETKTAAGTVYTAVAAHIFKTGLTVQAANTPTDVRYSNLNIDGINKKLWELAGLSTSPEYGEMLLGVKFTTATTTAGTVSAKVALRLQ